MKNCLHKKGFTLVEILVAVMIVVLLVTMAVPLYEKTVEKSRMAEARTMLKKILDAKLRTLDNMETAKYTSGEFGFEHLDISIPCAGGSCRGVSFNTKDFTYTLLPTGTLSGSSATLANAVFVARRTGDNKGVNFLYLGELETDSSRDKFLCNSGGVPNGCEAYGLSSTAGTAWCRPLP